MKHNFDVLNDGQSLRTCVAKDRRGIVLVNFVSHGLWNFTQPDEAGAGSSIKDDNVSFHFSYRQSKVCAKLIVLLSQYEYGFEVKLLLDASPRWLDKNYFMVVEHRRLINGVCWM